MRAGGKRMDGRQRRRRSPRPAVLLALAALVGADWVGAEHAALAPVAPASANVPELRVSVAVDADGRLGESWIEAIRIWRDEAEIAGLVAAHDPLDPEESEWVELARARSRGWPARMAALWTPFEGAVPPGVVQVVIGRGGGEDAFSPAATAIAFDIGRLRSIYGRADDGNGARLDRFFDHELTHVYHKAWISERRVRIDSPLEAALWECSKEGLGNLRSLSEKWRGPDGHLSTHAQATIERLGPILVERLGALSTAGTEEAPGLLHGLSTGPFEQKWGALPVALWLAADLVEDPDVLRKFVAGGPQGVLALARRHLPPELAAKLPARCESCSDAELEAAR